MSEDEACRRIQVVRLVRRFPELLVRIERGELTLSTMALLDGALTPSNCEELVRAAAGKTKAEVQALLAKRAPKPDVPAAITTVPVQSALPAVGVAPGSASAPMARADGPQLVPLSETRHEVQFTASDALRKKLERARDLMRHANADGDLAVVVERAMDLLIAKLERQRLAKASRPREVRADDARATNLASVSRATRRAVFERDGEQCTFSDGDGHRCPATAWLEFDHVEPRACGGTNDFGNLRVRCRAHNRLYAEQAFGREHVERAIRERGRPRQRGYATPSCAIESCALAARALTGMGFRRAEVRRALEAVTARHPGAALAATPVQAILREALAVLT